MDNDVLRQAPLFSSLDDEAATALGSSMTETKLRRGDALFHEGDSGDELYVVIDGKVKVGRSATDGRENLLAIMGPGQMFGELSLFDPGPRSATVTAVTDVTFASLSHDDLLKWLDGRPLVARGLLSQLAARLRKSNDVVADLVFSDVPGRVAKALLDLAERSPRRNWLNWSAPRGRRSTRPWPTSPRVAGCDWNRARWSSWTSNASASEHADFCLGSFVPRPNFWVVQ